MDTKDFGIHLAGAPYLVEQMRRSLSHDFRYFSLTAILIFGLTMAVMFRSWRIVLGMLATCASAVLLTLLLQALFGHPIGVMTVNLGTIVFVVTLSHLVYMTFNWQTLVRRQQNPPALAVAARRMTLPASFWSMICASLGFGSLLLVEAQPLCELGFWRRAWHRRGISLRVSDVSPFSAVVGAKEDKTSRAGLAAGVLDSSL